MSKIAPVVDFEIPGHRLVRKLGKGGMATVYLAIQASLGRPVAVKILHAPNDESVTRFEQEARTIARLDHPHIVAIYEVGRTSDGQLYFTMPYLPNGDLSKLDLRDAPLRAAAVLRALLGALGYAHAHGVVHRDVKPENVLFDKHGRALLADFGIARASESLRVTREGATVGSSGYMSPEQARGQPADGRSDLYSLGVVGYELLTGELPFKGVDALSTAIAHIEQTVPRLPPMKRAWQPLIDKALAKAPEDRFQTAQEMLLALDPIDGQRSGPAPVVKRGLRMSKMGIPRPWPQSLLVAVVVALVLALGLAAVAWWPRVVPPGPAVVRVPDDAQGPISAAPAPAPDIVAAAVAEPPAPASTAASAAAVNAQVSQLIGQGDALLATGNLTVPTGNSASDRYLAALRLDPANAAAQTGLGHVVASLQRLLDKAWRKDDATQTRDLAKKIDTLAPSVDAGSRKSWHSARGKLAAGVGAAVVAAVHARDNDKLAKLRPLALALPASYPAGFDVTQLNGVAPALRAGSPVRDRGGPALVYVPAVGKAPAFAVGRTEITRGEYAEFVRATRRAPARCAEVMNLFSRLRGLKWSDPGFAQTDSHPVVCVSWNDAVAYAAWLSHRTGQAYHLPSGAQWLSAAGGGPGGSPCKRGNVDDQSRDSKLDNDRWPCSDGAAQTAPVGRYVASGVGAYDMYGNVSEWTSEGPSGDRVFRGLSWRDGSQESALGRRGTAATDIGYTNVGFRVVRGIDPSHLPSG